MAGRSDIKAGGAFIELFVKDSAFVKGLNAAKKRLQNLGTGITQIGAGLTAIGAAALAPMLAAVHKFAESGDQIAKMARRTGVSTEALSELGFAAEQSGQSVEVLEETIKKMQKVIGGAELKSGEAAGLTSFEGKLKHLGVALGDLKDLAPEDQFEMLADRIAAIPDPTKRAAAAMEIFGKSGTALLPLMEKGAAGIQALRKEARELGLSKSEATTQVAEQLVDAFNRLKRVIGSTVSALGKALAPAMLEMLQIQTNIVLTARTWIKAHADQAVSVFRVLRTLTLVGGVVATIGGGIVALSSVFGAMASLIGGVGVVMGLLLNPVTLVVAAVAAGVYAWARFSASGQAAVQAVIGFFAPLIKTVQDTFAGISDALAGGDFLLAAQIGGKGLQVVFLQALESISNMIGGTLGAVIGDVGTRLIQGDFKGAWDTVVAGMAKLWADFAEGMVAIFTLSIRAIEGILDPLRKKISDTLLDMSAAGGILGKIASTVLGVDLAKEQRRSDELNRKLGLGPQDIAGEAKSAANQQLDELHKSVTGFLDGIDASFRQQSDAAGGDLANRLAGGGPSSALTTLQAELDALRQQAAEQRAKAGEKAAGGPGGVPTSDQIQAIATTFSGAGLLALGGGPQDRMARGIDKLAKAKDKELANDDKMIKALESNLRFG